MKIAVAGSGYVGLSLSVLLSLQNEVTIVDILPSKVDKINNGLSPIQDEYIEYYLKSKQLSIKATLDSKAAYKEAELVIIATPTNASAKPLTKQLMEDYDKTHASTIAVMKVPHEDVSSYGVIAPQGKAVKGLYSVDTFVEKPQPEDAPSDLAIIGRYLLTPEIFDILERQVPGAGNEVQLTDAIDTLNKTQRVFAREFKGNRYDVGDKFGFMKTSIDYALEHPQVKEDLKNYIIKLGKALEKSKVPTHSK
ncbi:TPA: sugar phosphate nucleotidyltransferase [Streptococcus pyogenes]